MLEIKNVTKIYENEKKAVDNISINIEKGDIFGFVGRNGAGKTTLIKCIVGLHSFNAGNISIDNISILEDPIAYKKKFAYVPDTPELYDYLTGIEYLNFISDIFEVSKDLRKERIALYGDKLEMTNNLGNYISSYSHGMKQRLLIISAFLHEPKVLILDEPFVGLDPNARIVVSDLMRKLCDEGGSVFFSTHALEEAQKLCNKIGIIKDGKLVIEGKTDQILEDKSLEEIFFEVTKNE